MPAYTQVQTNMGQDFWIAFPPNTSYQEIKLFISSDISTTGSVSSAVPGVGQDFSVTPGTITEILLPSGVQLSGYIENKGIHVTANHPVSLYGLNRMMASTDAYLALPVPSLGTEYWLLTYKTAFPALGSSLTVLATQNNTIATIYNAFNGSTQDITLQQGETYHVASSGTGSDMSGSHIQSNYPVAVFGSHKTTQIPLGCSAADHIVEQMQPVVSWGTNYVAIATAGRDGSGDVYRVLASQDNTQLSVNGTPVATLNQGAHYETELAGHNSFTANKPVCLAQFAKGIMCTGNITGDPFMIMIPPREQFLTHYTVSTMTQFAFHFVNVAAPNYAVGDIYQDGVLIPASDFSPIGTSGFAGAQLAVTEGTHTFHSTHPFGVFCYGWNPADSYGYAGGQSMSPVGIINSINIEPNTAGGTLNVTSLCFTAHVMDQYLMPVPGILVSFHVSGINPLTGTAFSNSNGDATYCYTQTGTVAGVDEIVAEVIGILSDTALVTWSPLPCANPSDGGTIGEDQSGCPGFLPSAISSLSSPVGFTGNLQYRWQYSVTGPASGFTDIESSDNENWNPGPMMETTWFRRLARVDCAPDWAGAAPSNVVKMTALPTVTPAISISATASAVCQGASVQFSAVITGGGTQPVFQWRVNGLAMGSNDPSFTFFPANGDEVTCTLTSSGPCPLVNPVTSDSWSIQVMPLMPVSVTIGVSANPVCQGTHAVFTATGMNAGADPQFQWKVNGINAGSGSASYAYIPANSDQVTCILQSSETCVTGNPATSIPLVMITRPVPVVTFLPCFDTVTRVNARPFRLRGGLPSGGSYTGPGIDPETAMFHPVGAGTGNHQISYTYTNIHGCTAANQRHIQVYQNAAQPCGVPVTDPRDNRVYATVMIGSRCWMQENLNYGTVISDLTPQTDNCIPERYIRSLTPSSVTAFYQWEELMNYEPAPGSQGLCPPGWHVPVETEWNDLLTVHMGPGQAGKPLQEDNPAGFRAYRSGVNYLGHTWNFAGFATLFWSSSSADSHSAISRGMNSANHSVSLYEASRANAFPIRCVRD